MKLANVIEGGVAGATTLTLLQEALHSIDTKSPRPFFHKSGVMKKLKKSSGKPQQQSKLFITLAGELLANAAYFGLGGLGKKKNAVLTGGLLGTAAGLGVAFLAGAETNHTTENANGRLPEPDADLKKKLLTVALFTAGGVVAGIAMKRLNKKSLKKLKKMITKG